MDPSWGEVLGVGLARVGSAKGGKMGQKQCELAADYGDRLGDERGSVWRLEDEDEQRAIWPPMRHL